VPFKCALLESSVKAPVARLPFSRTCKSYDALFQHHQQRALDLHRRINHDAITTMSFPSFSRIFSRARIYKPAFRDASFYLFGFATWIPAFVFINSHVAELSWIKGASMYPYLNTDFHRNLKQDVCINWKWAPLEGLQRGMIVTFWFVQ
jgi:hypothetical protein